MFNELINFSCWVDGKLCQREGSYLATVQSNTLLISPPPVKNAIIKIIYTEKHQPIEETFIGTSVDTVFKLKGIPDNNQHLINNKKQDSGYL